MLEILKETDRRLVMSLGERSSGWTKLILDKDAGFAWVERRHKFWPERTLTVALADIAAIEATGSTIVVATASNRRHRIAADADTARSAAARMRAFIGLDQAAALPAARVMDTLSFWGARAAAGTAIAGAAAASIWLAVGLGDVGANAASKVGGLVASAAARTHSVLLLPACDAPQSRDAIQELVRDRLGGGAVLGDITQRGQSADERFCGAVARNDGRTAKITYRNYWAGWTPKVRLTGEIVTAKLDKARTNAIAKATDTFLTASRNAHVTGKPPRQSDPAIDQALAIVFGASDLAAEALTADEIDKALDWLKTADRIGAVYILAGTGFDDFAAVPRTEALQKRIRGNVTAFADEFGRYADFQMITLAAIANAQMRASAPRTSAGRTEEIRARLSQAVTGNLIALVYDGHNDAWRMARLTALGRTAPVAAQFLTRDEAQAAARLALQTVDYFKDASVRAKVREVAGLLAAP